MPGRRRSGRGSESGAGSRVSLHGQLAPNVIMNEDEERLA
jgi:hypothetical protein